MRKYILIFFLIIFFNINIIEGLIKNLSIKKYHKNIYIQNNINLHTFNKIYKFTNLEIIKKKDFKEFVLFGFYLNLLINWQGYILYLLYFCIYKITDKYFKKKSNIIIEIIKKDKYIEKTNLLFESIIALCIYISPPNISQYLKLGYVTCISIKLNDYCKNYIKNNLNNKFLLLNNYDNKLNQYYIIIICILSSLFINLIAFRLKLINQNKDILISTISTQIVTFIKFYIEIKYNKNMNNHELLNILNSLLGTFLSIFIKILI